MTDTLVANILLTQAAEKSSLVISDEAVAEEVAKIEANAPEGKNLRDLLAENKMDFDEWKTDLRKQMLVGKLVEEKTATTEEATAIETAKHLGADHADELAYATSYDKSPGDSFVGYVGIVM